MAKGKNVSTSKKRKAKSAPRNENSSNIDQKIYSRMRELEDKITKGKSPKVLKTSIDLIAKSDSRPFGYLLSNSIKRVVIQLWTESFKLDEIFKKKILKATKHWEHILFP